MNKYLIKYKIATLAELIESFSYEGFQFDAYDKENFYNCDAWVASRTIEAETAGEARSLFISELTPLIERFSVISQCSFRLVANTYVIYKLTSNKEKVIYIYYVRQTEPVGLHFDKDEISQLSKFSSMSDTRWCQYMMDASNATTFYTKLSMLIGALEGLAGQIDTPRGKKTNKEELKKIVGEETYNKLFPYETGLRNQLFHGNITTHGPFDGLVEEIYDAIRLYLKHKFGIELSESVVHPQRNFHDNFEYAGMWMRLVDDNNIDLRLIDEALDDRFDNYTKHDEMFAYCQDSPTNY